jgi:hypothetical protein
VDTEGQTRFDFCTTLFESQTENAGQVCFTDQGSTVLIEITLNSNYIFEPGGAYKIQDYATAPINQSSSPGQFDYSGSPDTNKTASAVVTKANFYAVHALVIYMPNSN